MHCRYSPIENTCNLPSILALKAFKPPFAACLQRRPRFFAAYCTNFHIPKIFI